MNSLQVSAEPIEPCSPAERRNIPRAALEAGYKWREINQLKFEGRVSPKSVIHITSAYFGIGYKEITGQVSLKYIVHPRYAAMHIMRKLCVSRSWGNWKPLAYQGISNHFNRSVHTYALHADRAVIKRMNSDVKYKKDIDNIIYLLGR